MFLTEAGCAFISFILYISGVQGRANSICALKTSSVDLHCSAQRPTTRNKWFTVEWDGYKFVQNELSVDGNHVTYMSEESHPTLTINYLIESDANNYCCRENADDPRHCWSRSITLHVADLQVKVIPATEGQTMTLMCSTSCPLTENPAVYIWYKNREFLYQDSPWYQQLVSSEKGVRYSCAIKGYEDLRAPPVSVDSVTANCFSVTYAEGRLCSYQQTSEDEPCSVTYPREVHIQRTAAEVNDIRLTCNTNCPLIDSKTAFKWYQGGSLYRYRERQELLVTHSSDESFSCAVKGLEDLHSAEVCAEDRNCWSVNYVSRRICALEGSSVNISSLRVKFTPSAEVTEGQRVTLSCSTSCPLTDNTNYIWYLNSRPLTPTEKQNKHLVLDPVSSQHAGKYSCAVKTPHNISSCEKTLTVQSEMGKWTPAAAAVCAALLVIIPFTVFWWNRRKRTFRQNHRTETSDNMEQINSGAVYDNISAPPPEQAGLHYSRVHFSKSQMDPLYSTVQPHQPREQEHVHYAVVDFRRNRTPE
ncbi:sialoadhesin-like [Sander vitreus]